jgi:hypothetical protein
MPPYRNYTTQDELGFVHRLAVKCLAEDSTRRLDSYLKVARVRRWHGPGMVVDPGQVILEAEDELERVENCLEIRRLSIAEHGDPS